jgi:hypothetical protein
MTLGATVTQVEVNQAAAAIGRQAFSLFQTIKEFTAYLAGTPDVTLTAMGFSVGEVAQLKSGMTDLDQLRTVFEGTATRTPAYDYRTFSKLFLGIGIY